MGFLDEIRNALPTAQGVSQTFLPGAEPFIDTVSGIFGGGGAQPVQQTSSPPPPAPFDLPPPGSQLPPQATSDAGALAVGLPTGVALIGLVLVAALALGVRGNR